MNFADRLNNVETSAIRELFKLLGKPGIISFAGGFPDSAMFDVDGIREAAEKALREEPGGALQYGATEGYQPLREQLADFMATKGAKDLAPEGLIVTTGSQQARLSRPLPVDRNDQLIAAQYSAAWLELVEQRAPLGDGPVDPSALRAWLGAHARAIRALVQ